MGVNNWSYKSAEFSNNGTTENGETNKNQSFFTMHVIILFKEHIYQYDTDNDMVCPGHT
jgi:hypothetical protein